MNSLEQFTKKIFGGNRNDEDFGAKALSVPLSKITDISEQSIEEQKLAAMIKNEIDQARTSGSRVAQEGIMLTNVAYLLGYDSVAFNSQVRQFRPTDLGARMGGQNRIHVNKILPTINNRLARLCKNPPRWDVLPESSDQEDKDAARLGQVILENIWHEHRVNQKRLNLMMQVQQYGYAFVKISWDLTKGKKIRDPETNQMMPEGDLRIEPVSPLGVFCDPMAKSMEEAQKITIAKVRDLNYFKSQYPERGELVKEEGAWLLSIQNEQRINEINNQGATGTNAQQQMKNSAIELSRYEKPSTKFPNGRHTVVANGVVLLDKDLPIDELTIVKFDDILIGDRFASESVITHMRPIQDQYNRVLRKRAQWVNRLLAGKFSAPKGHGMSSETLTNESGEVVEYNPQPNAPEGGRPVPLETPNIPQYAYEEEKSLEENLYDIAGIGEVARAQLPAAGMPAKGMEFLQEQDDTRIGVITESNEYSWADVGRICLKFYGKFAITPRIYRMSPGSSTSAIKKFQGKDLRDNFNVMVVRGSTIPGSKVLKRQEILNTYNQGLLGDPMDPKLREKVLSMLEYGDVAEMWQDLAIDMAQIRTDLDLIEKEEMPDVNELDNHPLHIQEKNRYRKGEKFKRLSDASKAILLANIEAHIQEIVNLANPSIKENMDTANSMQKLGESNLPPSDPNQPQQEPVIEGAPQ